MEPESRHIKYLKLALLEADKSEYQHRIGAIFVQGKRILSKGYNSVRYLSKGVNRYTTWKCSVHAERHCLSQLDKEIIKGGTLYVARQYKGSGGFSLAAPCGQCLYMCVDLSVKRIIFSVPEYPYYEIMKLY